MDSDDWPRPHRGRGAGRWSSPSVLVAIGPDWMRRHIAATAAVLAAALLYSLVLLVYPRPEVRRTRWVGLST